GQRRLFKRSEGQEERRADRHQYEAAHQAELQSTVARAKLVSDGGQDQRQQQRAGSNDLVIGRDARPLVIISRNLARPGLEGDLHCSPAKVEEKENDAERQWRHPKWRKEEKGRRHREHETARRNPWLSPSIAAPGRVAERAYQGICERIPQPSEEEDHADRRQRQPIIARINGGKIDAKRQTGGGERDGQRRETNELAPGGRRGAHSFVLSVTPRVRGSPINAVTRPV